MQRLGIPEAAVGVGAETGAAAMQTELSFPVVFLLVARGAKEFVEVEEGDEENEGERDGIEKDVTG
jgi:hypothetical protein